jgi:HAD superfamily hydrolase (TIGR01509 family)
MAPDDPVTRTFMAATLTQLGPFAASLALARLDAAGYSGPVPERKCEAWLVDLDGTLYWALGVKLLMAAELGLFGLHKAARLRRFRHEHERLRAEASAPDGDPFREQLERTARGLGLPTAELEADVRSWMVERPARYLRWFRRSSLLAEVAAFREQGGRTALVSDYPAIRKLDALGARDLFEVVVASGEPNGPGRLKPAPDGYLRAARALGVAPEYCLVVGDREDADGAAARAAGMAFRRIGG